MASGVRSSCAATETNSSRTFSASSTARCCADMSRAMLEAPTIAPSPSRTGEIVTETVIRSPFFFRRVVW